MTIEQLIFGSLLVLILLGSAGIFAWRQGVALRALHQRKAEISEQEAQFQRRQITRRLICSGLMGLLAILLGAAMIFLEGPTQRIVDTGITNAGERELFKAYGYYWIAFLLILFGLLVMAGADFWANRQHGLKQYRKLQADRKAMIKEQIAEMRQKRNKEGE